MQSLKKLDIGCAKKPKDGYDGLDILDIEGIKYPRADAMDLPIEDEVYDEIHSRWLLEHFSRKDIPALLREWKRVLVPGGKISLVANNQYAINEGLANGDINWLEWERLSLGSTLNTLGGVHKVFLTPQCVEDMLKEVGFNKIKIRSTNKVRGKKGELKCPGIIITAMKLS